MTVRPCFPVWQWTASPQSMACCPEAARGSAHHCFSPLSAGNYRHLVYFRYRQKHGYSGQRRAWKMEHLIGETQWQRATGSLQQLPLWLVIQQNLWVSGPCQVVLKAIQILDNVLLSGCLAEWEVEVAVFQHRDAAIFSGSHVTESPAAKKHPSQLLPQL